ncbi:hypothetical protein BY996DRAFT_4586003, partial [Phakopsora pachyrhizi]
LVLFLLHRTKFLKPVKNNTSKKGGIMYADGWRKCIEKEIFGRYIDSSALAKVMKKEGFNVEDEETQYKKIGSFLSEVFQDIAKGAFNQCHQELVAKHIPSFTAMNYHPEEGFQPEDFSSAITFTFNNFFNTSHCDRDGSNWTLIGFIPLTTEGGFLANNDFDLQAGQFILRDFKIPVDFSKTLGITVLVLDTANIKHQTLPSFSPSGKFTRFGFSCQVSKSLSNTLDKYYKGFYGDECYKNFEINGYDSYMSKVLNKQNKMQKK